MNVIFEHIEKIFRGRDSRMWMAAAALAAGIYFFADFLRHRTERAEVLYYDFRNFKPEKTWKIRVDTLSYNFCRCRIPEGFTPDNQKWYRLKKEGTSRFFRAVYWRRKDSFYEAYGVRWLNGVPTPDAAEAELSQGILPFRQRGNISAVCIGDDLMLNRHAPRLRFMLNRSEGWVFQGNYTDVAGFPVQALLNADAARTADLARNAPEARYYVIFFDGKRRDTLGLASYMRRIDSVLKAKNARRIFWIALPPVKEKHAAAFRRVYNRVLDSLESRRVRIVRLPDSLPSGPSAAPDGYPVAEAWEYIYKSIVDEIRP